MINLRNHMIDVKNELPLDIQLYARIYYVQDEMRCTKSINQKITFENKTAVINNNALGIDIIMLTLNKRVFIKVFNKCNEVNIDIYSAKEVKFNGKIADEITNRDNCVVI